MTTRIHRLSPLATKSGHSRVTPIDEALVRQKATDARANSRLREIHVFHSGDEDTLQRMLNALQPGSYVTPHRHTPATKAEPLVLLQGSVGFVPFLDDGTPDEENFICLSRERGVVGLDCRGDVWHTFFALEPDSVVFEVKPGPFVPDAEKLFAAWAPGEDDPGASAYLARLEDRFRQRFGLGRRVWEA